MAICSSRINLFAAGDPPFYTPQAEAWADSVLITLSAEQRIAQLIMVAAWSNKDAFHEMDIRWMVERYGIGGLIFFQGGPVREAMLTNKYQSLAKVPLLIGMDAEWGLAMRLDSTIRFPRQMTMAAIDDDQAVYEMGNEIAKNCKRLGIHVNFAPDADINNNPLNPIIGSRSFGDDKESVARKSVSYLKALQDNHILGTGKHFPGHGNADSDSHLMLPTINQDVNALDSVELYPFKKLIASGMGGMMVAHLNVPSLDPTLNLPSTLSSKIVKDLLKDELGFKGLIFTDALNMKGVTISHAPGVVDKMALLAGNDILLYSENVPKAISEIKIAVDNCEISQEEIDTRVKKMLMVKYWCGLNNYRPVDTTNIVNDLNNPAGKLLQRRLYEKAVTVLENKDSLLPFRSKEPLRIASVVIGDAKHNPFQEQLRLYGNIDFFAENKDAPVSIFDALFNFLSNYDYVILSLHGTSMKAQNDFGISESANKFIDSVMIKYKTVFTVFGNAYTLSKFKNLKSAEAVVLAYEDFSLPHSIAAQIIMGGLSASGKIPVISSLDYERYAGIRTHERIKMQYTIPESANMSARELNRIDSLVEKAILSKALPGCQVLVARSGKVVYHKAFGTHIYDLCDTVKVTDLYDIASITKISATALAAMKLYDKKKINFEHSISKYLPKIKNSNKKNTLLIDMLTHQAGFQSWIPFYKQTLMNNRLKEGYYNTYASNDFTLHVADSLYMHKNYTDTIMQAIYNSSLGQKGKYVYSDLGPILMKEIIEKITDEPLDEYVHENFYAPLGLNRISFHANAKYPKYEIVPTEFDTVFRHQVVHGFVHDPAAAMLGGVSGNSGVFSNANDLAVIMQMLLNKGSYAGINYIKPSTVELFTKQQFPENRRGILFDKPEPDPSKQSPCAKQASPRTFGHQGFTGTCAWADPEYDLIYIFLSNRIHPDVSNDKFLKMNVRTNIHEIIYDSILDKK